MITTPIAPRRSVPGVRSVRNVIGAIVNLPDGDLLRLRDEAAAEIARRCPEQLIDLSDIKSQEGAKRALTIAIAGKHSLLLIGSPGCGKTMLRSVARQFDLLETFETRPCPCGNRNDPHHACSCTATEIKRHVAAFPNAEINIEVPPVPVRESTSRLKGSSNGDLQSWLDRMGPVPPLVLDELGDTMLKSMATEGGVSAAVLDRAMRVAATIAALDQKDRIAAVHLVEAINYRPFLRS